ncbi:calcium-binding protein [Thioclava sp. GXIMD4215]|uniref:calcium-binding protein n=1 Tax=Thioclava sp. GXIMD4215 TaxID=3131928 RepID=UPI003248CFEA
MSYILGSSAADEITAGFVDANGVTLDYTGSATWETFLNIWAGRGNDRVTGVEGRTIVHGQAGDDYLSGSNLVATPSLDHFYPQLFGDEGNDTIEGSGNVLFNGNAGNDTITWSGQGYASLSGEYGDDVITANMTAVGAESARIFTGQGADTVNITLGDNDTASVFLAETEAAADVVNVTSDIDAETGGLVDLGSDFDPSMDTLVVNGVTYSGDDLSALVADPENAEGVDISSATEYSGNFTYLAFSGNDEGGPVTIRLSSDIFADEESSEEAATDPGAGTGEEATLSDNRVDGTEEADFMQDLYVDADGDSTADTVRINGFGGDDYIRVKSGLSHVIGGGEGNDSLYAVSGEHHLAGEAGDDLIVGGNDTCLLEGGKGDDTLVGYLDHGADHVMHLGKGNDVVDLRGASDTATSNVTVTDFRFGEDVLMFDGEAVDFSALPDDVSGADDEDGNLVLSFHDDDSVTLQGQSVASMQSYGAKLQAAKDAQLADGWSDDNEAEDDSAAWAELEDESTEAQADASDSEESTEALDETTSETQTAAADLADIPTVPVAEDGDTEDEDEDEALADA